MSLKTKMAAVFTAVNDRSCSVLVEVSYTSCAPSSRSSLGSTFNRFHPVFADLCPLSFCLKMTRVSWEICIFIFCTSEICQKFKVLARWWNYRYDVVHPRENFWQTSVYSIWIQPGIHMMRCQDNVSRDTRKPQMKSTGTPQEIYGFSCIGNSSTTKHSGLKMQQ